MISKMFFGAGVMFIIIATLLFILNHAGVSAKLINISFILISLGTCFYLWEIANEKK